MRNDDTRRLVVPAIDENIERAAEIIKKGGLAAFPTETVYGLGADAFNEKALAKVFTAKKRPYFDPLIVHIARLDALSRVARVHSLEPQCRVLARKLAETLWPGPLTLVLPKQPEIPGICTGNLDTVAVRFPSNKIAQALIARSTGAVAAPSANPFGSLSPTRAEHVADGLGNAVDIILDGGPCAVGVESTVLDLTVWPPKVLRPGGCPLVELEKVKESVGNRVQGLGFSSAPAARPQPPERSSSPKSPGQLKSHYAPKTRLDLYEYGAMPETAAAQGEARVYFSAKEHAVNGVDVFALSSHGDTVEAAARLFDLLHCLDGIRFELLRVEKAPEGGKLTEAINDRLTKAANKFIL
jgi:L-threonylcarbamoyladenylate synthase